MKTEDFLPWQGFSITSVKRNIMKSKSRNTIDAAGKSSAAPKSAARRQEGLGEEEQKQMLRKDSREMNKLNKGNADQGNRSSNPRRRGRS